MTEEIKYDQSLYNSSADGYEHLEALVKDKFDDVVANNAHLFTTNVDPGAIWDAYLSNIPEGAPRSHYTCHGCRQFIQRFGNLVYVDTEGNKHSAVWSTHEVPQFFKKSVEAMHKLVMDAVIDGVFVPESATLGTPRTGEWTHLSAKLPKSRVHKDRLKTAYQVAAEKVQDFEMLMNALILYSAETVDTALQLLESETMYRADRVIGPARWFKEVIALRDQATTSDRKRNRVWLSVASAPTGFTHIRSSMIGTLLDDISEGMSYQLVATRFAEKMAPGNYMRSQSAPSANAIQQAEKVVEKLGIANSLGRRYATREEVPTIWEPKGTPKELAEKKPTGGVFGHLAPKQPTTNVAGQSIPAKVMTWEKFQRTVMPTADAMEVLVDNPSKFMAIVTAADPTAENILQWDNPFSWYYHGGVDAEIRQRLEQFGGRYEGNEIRVSLIWEGYTDLDLHCITPHREHIYYNDKRARCGGYLDLDMNGLDKNSDKPVENIRWTNAPEGHYRFYVHNFNEKSNRYEGTPFRVELEINGQVYHYDGQPLRSKQDITVFEFDYKKGQQPILQSTGTSSATDWTVEPNKFVKVTGITTSPNLWGDNPRPQTGTHVFFLLDGVRDTSEGKGRGFFNEMLKPELREIRKTLEAYTGSTPIQGADEASACGVGYNKDTEWDLTVKVTSGNSSRLIKIDRWD